ncbi:cyclic nucleotide-binding domain-containing protein, partial [Myxococcota bacterium]|nr:cyclic nucleotide-binding domain-containing protein [Myxococcota bacterium]MBU1537230.1 cyclic nucleotide-binding domain-containing protein [Myxococcota bacterium]
LKDFARANIDAQRYSEALKAMLALFKADPLDVQTRFIAVDLLIGLNKPEALVSLLINSAQLAMEAGHPASCMSFLHMLEKGGVTSTELWSRFSTIYAKGSERISKSGSRLAPFEDEHAVEGPQELALDDESLLKEILTEITRKEKWVGFPPHLVPMPLFSDLDSASFLKASKGLLIHRLKPDELIIREGEPGTSFYILCQGSLNVYKTDVHGRNIPLATLHQGSIFGEMALVQRMPRGASVITMTHSEILEFPAANLGQLAQHLPVVAEALDRFTRDRLLGNLLATSHLFKPFSKKQRKDLLRHFQAYVVETDTVVVREGEEGTGLYLVLSGEMEVVKNQGLESEVKLATLKTSDAFGEISLLQDSPTTAAVVATTRSTLLFLSKHFFSRLVNSVPQLKDYYSRLGENRVQATRSLMADTTEDEDEFILI